jgi:hypothetical protein
MLAPRFGRYLGNRNNAGTRQQRLSGMAVMVHLLGKNHLFDWACLDRVESAIMLSLIGSGLAACVMGAAIYDFGRMFSIW